jgi:hypothetical protein
MRSVASIISVLLCAPMIGATLEKLSVEQMAQQSTIIIRGRVTGCAGEARGPVIYTRCSVAVSETWKGTPVTRIEFLAPGGTARGLMQTFSGAPRFAADEQYVLFLWVGRSGVPQIIGLSQGVFDVSQQAGGDAVVRRKASTAVMLDSKGKQVRDEAIGMPVGQLRQRVARALASGAQK